MVSRTMIQLVFLGFLIVSTALADVKSSKNVKRYIGEFEIFANPSAYSFSAKNFGSSTPVPLAFGSSFSSTASPLTSISYSSNPASLLHSNTFSSNAYSSSVAAQSFDSTSFTGSSTPEILIGSSTPTPFSSGDTVSDSRYAYSYRPSVLIGGFTPVVSSTPESVVSNKAPDFVTTYDSYYSGFAPAYARGGIVKSETTNHDSVKVASVHANIPTPHREVTITKEVPVPYYGQVEKRVPYPVVIRTSHPYTVPVEKHVPYAVQVNVDRPIHVPQPYPVEVEKRVPYSVEKPVPYEVKVPVDRSYPVYVSVEKPVPYTVERPVTYPVRVNVDRPYPVEKPAPYLVSVEKPVPYPVEKAVPYSIEKLVPYTVEEHVPYPVKYEVPVKIPVPVEVKVPITVDRPVPYPVEKKVPYPVQVPVELKVSVPIAAPAQRFATVHYYQQSPVAVGYESAQAFGAKSGYKSYASISEVPAYGNSYHSIISSPASFYTSTPSSANYYSSTDSPINTFSSIASPVGLLGSNIVREGFSSIPLNFGQQSHLETSTSAPLNVYSVGSNPADASSLFKSANFGSNNQEVVAIGRSSYKSHELKSDSFDVVKK